MDIIDLEKLFPDERIPTPSKMCITAARGAIKLLHQLPIIIEKVFTIFFQYIIWGISQYFGYSTMPIPEKHMPWQPY